MGNLLTINMEENFRRNQDFITEMNTIKIERQIQMQYQVRERELALKIARSRELFFWYGSFYLVSLIGLISKYRNTKNRTFLMPLIPLTFVMAYQADLAYGNKLHRIQMEAEHILQFEQDLLMLPGGLPTASSIDQGRIENDEVKKLHPAVPAL